MASNSASQKTIPTISQDTCSNELLEKETQDFNSDDNIQHTQTTGGESNYHGDSSYNVVQINENSSTVDWSEVDQKLYQEVLNQQVYAWETSLKDKSQLQFDVGQNEYPQDFARDVKSDWNNLVQLSSNQQISQIAQSFENIVQKPRPRDNDDQNDTLGQDVVQQHESNALDIQLNSDLKIDCETELVIERELGTGAFGNVFKAKWLTRGINVAVKELHPYKSSRLAYKGVESLCQEIEILSRLPDNPRIIKCYGACLKPPSYCLLLEYAENGDLGQYIHHNQEDFSLEKVLNIALQIAEGLAQLHPTIVHRDLKPQNVLLDQHFNVKIADFGLAKMKQNTYLTVQTNNPGTFAYMAPEVLQGNENVSEKCDIYALGMILWEMYTRQKPWPTLNQGQIIVQVMINQKRPDIPMHCPHYLRTLINRCWAQNPKTRPGIGEVQDMIKKCLMRLERDKKVNIKGNTVLEWKNKVMDFFYANSPGSNWSRSNPSGFFSSNYSSTIGASVYRDVQNRDVEALQHNSEVSSGQRQFDSDQSGTNVYSNNSPSTSAPQFSFVKSDFDVDEQSIGSGFVNDSGNKDSFKFKGTFGSPVKSFEGDEKINTNNRSTNIVRIGSAAFPGRYVHIENNDNHKVNIVYSMAQATNWKIHQEGENIFSFEMVDHPNLFLSGQVDDPSKSSFHNGGGEVSLRQGVSDTEKWIINSQDGTIGLENCKFRNWFLRLDGQRILSGTAGGNVNLQENQYDWECVRIDQVL